MKITVIVILNKNAQSQTKSSSKQLYYYSEHSIFSQLYSQH